MPPAVIIAAITAAISAAGTGVGIYESTHQPKPSLRPTPQQVGQTKAQLASAANQDAPNTIEATGGGVSPNYLANAVANQTGQQGNISQLQDIIKAAFGGGGATTGDPFSGGGNNPFSGGGGNTNFPSLDVNRQPTQGPGFSNLVDPRIFGEGA